MTMGGAMAITPIENLSSDRLYLAHHCSTRAGALPEFPDRKLRMVGFMVGVLKCFVPRMKNSTPPAGS